MELEKKRIKPSPKKKLQRYLFPITIISSILISGSIGYTASRIAVNNSGNESVEIHAMKNQMTEARDNSLKVVEKEIPEIIDDLERYNQNIDLMSENIKWLNENLAPIRDATGKFDTAISVVRGVSTVVNVPLLSKTSTGLASAQIKLDKIDSMLVDMENLKVMQQEMSDSHKKLNLLYEEYQKDKNIEQLLQIEEELNSTLIYQIEDLRNITVEAHEVFELSSGVLSSVNTAKSFLSSIQEQGGSALETIQFWKDNKVDSEIGGNLKENLETDLDASKKEIQDLPDELAQQSRKSITSITTVQKELQTIKIAQMVISE
ncbi:hypothetical protein [Planococcus sp. YIM B11945]|uniref:hypothetical protein n=1 Tax=Planococcus sp. YIM B11945 TaxID=3435410 RepID=UPI003D7E88AF